MAMAPKPLSKRQQDELRANIPAPRIIKRLDAHIMYQKGAEGYDDPSVVMTPAQVQAAKVLLDKVLPSLQAVEVDNRQPSENPGSILDKIEKLIRERPELLAVAARHTIPAGGSSPGQPTNHQVIDALPLPPGMPRAS